MLWIPPSIAKKHFALVGLPSHYSGCIEINKSSYRVEKRVLIAPQEEIMK